MPTQGCFWEVITLVGDFPLAPTLLQAALRSSWHFACVSGPNIGLVVSPLGRPQEFPAQIQIFTDNRGREHMSFLLDSEDAQIWIRPAAFIPWRRLRPKRVYTPAKGMQLKVSGSSASDYYQLRQRPRDLSFPSASRTSRHLPTMPFIGIVPLLLFMVLRMLVMGSYGGMSLLLFVVPLISMSILGIVVMKRGKPRHRIDAAWLALLLETAVPSISESSSLLVYPNHIGRGKALTVSGTDGETYLGFVGPEAKLSALWCAAQLAAQLGGARVAEGTDELIDIGRQKSLGPGAANSRSCRASIRLHAPGEDENGDENIHLAWAHHFNELPTWCHTVIPASRAPVSLAWWKMLGRDTLFGSIPECVDFDELPFEVIDSDEGLRTPIGKDNSGVVHIDLVKHGPHALIAGTTGSGKSEALRTWLLGLCESYSPSRLRLVLVDYKGGSALTPLTALPHTETVLTDLNLAHSSRALRGLASCIATREAQFAQYAVKDLSQWHERFLQECAPPPPPRILIVIDEFQVLADLHPETLETFSRLAAQGRSLGLHLIYATQHPGASISAHMRANTELRIALRSIFDSDSHSVIGSAEAAHLPRIPGRALLGSGKPVQFAYCRNIEQSIASISKKQSDSIGAPLWCPSLPSQLTRGDLDQLHSSERGIPIGLIDGIENGTHRCLTWQHGNIMMSGSGSSTNKLALLVRSCATTLSDSLGFPLCGVSIDSGIPNSIASSPDYVIRDIVDFGVLCEDLCHRTPCVVWLEDIEGTLHMLEERLGVLRAHDLWGQFARSCDGVNSVLIASEVSGRFTSRTLFGSYEHIWYEIPNPQIAESCPTIRGAECTDSPAQLWSSAHKSLICLCTDSVKPSLPLSIPSWNQILHDCQGQLGNAASRQMNSCSSLPLDALNASALVQQRPHFPITPAMLQSRVASLTKTNPDMRIHSYIIRYGAQLKRFLFSEKNCTFIGEDNSVLIDALRAINAGCIIHHFEHSQWMRALETRTELLLFTNPPKEALRFIAQNCQSFPSSLYALSWNSYSGVIVHRGTAGRFVLTFK